jgi:hypothetical protein
MPSFQDVLLCGLAALAICVTTGLPLARCLVDEPRLAWALAPALGWAAFSALALPILSAAGFSRAHVTVLCGVAVLVGVVASLRRPARLEHAPAVPIWAFAAAAALAILPALGVWPKLDEGGLVLAEPLFDHSKIAIVDDIARLGLPPGNPFFGEAGALAYYYLWHFSAAVVAALVGANGWEADIALTWFTGFASLALMMGLAVQLGGQSLAAPLVVLLSLAASLWPPLRLLFPSDFVAGALSQSPWPHSWIFQASWVPQHLASASCVVLAVLILSRLGGRRSWPLVPLLAVVVAAGFESSVWVGGIVFATAALPIGIVLLRTADDARQPAVLLVQAAVAGAVALALSFPFLRDEYAATAARQLGAGIVLRPFAVLGPLVPDTVRRIADLPAYWAVVLVIEFPAIYFAGTWAMAGALADRSAAAAQRRLVVGFVLLASASFGIPWLFASTIANNDLAWRGVLPGILVLTIFAAAGVARWSTTARGRATAAFVCIALGIPGGIAIAWENAVGLPSTSAAALAETPGMWAAVRRHAAPDERVGNNPLFLDDSVRWPINISWALFADRRSCYAGWNFARAFVPLPKPEIDRLETLFDRVFAGHGTAEEVGDFATRYRCRVIVVTSRDGSWNSDPFVASGYFHLVEQKEGQWRIYRVDDAVQ